MQRLASPVALALLALLAGCAGPPVPAPIQGEPVCPDFVMGPTRAPMMGSLEYPVELRVTEGKNQIMKLPLHGLRKPTDPKARTLIPDDNAEYKIEWAQCPNLRAPVPVGPAHEGKEGAREHHTVHYECGDAVVYKTDTLVTRKKDPASHVVTFADPPKNECWTDQAPPAPAAPPTTDGGAPGVPAPAAAGTDAGAAGADAGPAK